MKIALCGDSQGRNTIIEQYVGNQTPISLMGGQDLQASLKESLIDGRAIKFQIWNFGDERRMEDIRSVYFLGTVGAVVVFDVLNVDSFEKMKNWIKHIWNHNEKGVIPTIILGHNIDLRNQYPNAIQDEMVHRYCSELSKQINDEGLNVKYFPITDLDAIYQAFDYLGRMYFQMLDRNKKV